MATFGSILENVSFKVENLVATFWKLLSDLGHF